MIPCNAVISGHTLTIASDQKCHNIPLQLYYASLRNIRHINKKTYYPIALTSCNDNEIVLFTTNEDDQMKWFEFIQHSVCRPVISQKYKLGNILGKGTFGFVRLGQSIEDGTKVAIKTITKSVVKNKAQFKREIDSITMCKHPNIVKFYETSETQHEIYIITEYISGGSLSACLSSPISEDSIRHIVDSVASALYYLHELGIIHRDIKLENLLFTDDTRTEIKLVDFGFSAFIGPDESLKGWMGTLYYSAPEIVKREPYNGQVDVWSLGVVLYALLYLTLPFCHSEEEDLINQILTKEPIYDGKCRRSSEAQELLMSMLKKDAKERITLEEVLLHPFITKNRKEVRESSNVLEKFACFSLPMKDQRCVSSTNMLPDKA